MMPSIIAALTADTEQKGLAEEDPKNKKLLPLLRDAYDLVMRIEGMISEKTDKIVRLHQSQRVLTDSLKLRPSKSLLQTPKAVPARDLGRSQTGAVDEALFKYKYIMCPLGDRCPGDVRPRWPDADTKSICKLGQACPYAHHYSELHFVYLLVFSCIRGIDRKTSREIRASTDR